MPPMQAPLDCRAGWGNVKERTDTFAACIAFLPRPNVPCFQQHQLSILHSACAKNISGVCRKPTKCSCPVLFSS